MKENPPPPLGQIPEWLEKARQVSQEQSTHDSPSTMSVALEVFYERDLPSTRLGVEAKDDKGRTIWLTRSIARKIYNCAGCSSRIELGEEHSLVRIQSGTNIDDHHHLHKSCSHTWIDFEKPYNIFRDSNQNDRRINKRQARSRAKRRRRHSK